MLDYLIAFWTVILRLCGWAAPAPAFARSRTNANQNEAPPPNPAPRSPRLRLSRVTGPRVALTVIADAAGQVSGTPRLPRDPDDLEVAWLQLGDPVADFVKARIALGEAVPRLLESDDENAKLDELATQARRSPKTYIRAIWRGAPIGASLQATTALAHRVQRLFRGAVPTPVRTPGPAGECEWHVVDSMGRPVICRLIKHEGRLEILDGRGGLLHEDTLRLSWWRLSKGWITAGGFHPGGRPDGDGDGPPNPELRPNPVNPRI
ncbi:hypothetical protein JQ612_02365 [Bradyrhizobium manausense]|uniref:hypothetical protein n=1 Tax=Bradyrhizobium manausense TaxID=989370 RepID=UPI001BA9563F|nr:hypothetical protein [Bradyrhizobium manausense]MBR0832022.1 hypothetical protein [Bradyrhizobium manausense]